MTRLQDETIQITPRLFECSNQTGTFIATEITNFNQTDLDEDDIMLLDIWDQVNGLTSHPTPTTLPPHKKKLLTIF